MKNVLAGFVIVALFFPSSALASGNVLSAKQAASDHVPGELILKFQNNSKYILQIEEVIDGEKLLEDLDLGVYLNAFMKQNVLVDIKRVYPKVASREDLIKKFPERAKRMPKNSEAPDLRPTYIFKFASPKNELKILALRCMKDGDVEYADVNQIITIHDEIKSEDGSGTMEEK